MRGILIAVANLAVIESLSLLGLGLYWRAVRADILEPKPKQLLMCTLLDILVTGTDDENRKRCPKVLREEIEKQTNSTRCCGSLTDIMDGLVSKVIISVAFFTF